MTVCEIKNKVKKNKAEIIGGASLFFVTYVLVNRMTYYEYSDYMPHIIFAQGIGQIRNLSLSNFLNNVSNSHIISYPIWHIIFLCLTKIIGLFLKDSTSDELMGITAGVEMGIFMLLAYYFTCYYIKKYLKENKYHEVYAIFAIGLFVMGPLYVPHLTNYYYLGQLMPNTWHNPTTIAVKFISIICFFMFYEIIENKGLCKKSKYIVAGTLLFISAFIKPSFYQMFVPGLFLYCVYELIAERGKLFWAEIKIGLTVLPVTLLALLQMQLSFGKEGDGIGVGFMEVWGEFAPYPLLSLLISIPFPILVYMAYYKDAYREKKLALAIFTLLSAVGQYAFLYKIDGPLNADFAWGTYLAVFLANMIALILLLQRKSDLLKKKSFYILTWCVYGIQVFCGILYVMQIYILKDCR